MLWFVGVVLLRSICEQMLEFTEFRYGDLMIDADFQDHSSIQYDGFVSIISRYDTIQYNTFLL